MVTRFKNVLQLTGYTFSTIAAITIAAVLIPTILAGFAIILLGFLAFFVLIWAVGGKITIKQGKEKIGYVRWTKFYPTRGGL